MCSGLIHYSAISSVQRPRGQRAGSVRVLSSPRVHTECRCARLRFRMWTKLKPGSGGVLTLYALGLHPLAALPWGYSMGAFTPTLGSHNRTELGFDPGVALYKQPMGRLDSFVTAQLTMSFGLKAAQKPGPPLGRRRKTPPEVVPRYLLNIKPSVVPRVLLWLCGRWAGRAGASLTLYQGPVMYMREGDVALLLPSPAAGSSFPTFPFRVYQATS